jgi:hypothetical protein
MLHVLHAVPQNKIPVALMNWYKGDKDLDSDNTIIHKSIDLNIFYCQKKTYTYM